LSDYLALFLIRAWLPLFGGRTIEALIAGPFAASVGVFCMGMAMRIGAATALLHYKGITDFDPRSLGFVTLELAIPAIVVFVWLPLFGVGIAAVRFRNTLSMAVGRTQLFLKEGSEHPLKAVGLVAAVVVFIVAASWPLAVWLLAHHSEPPVG
jgi:hypothetical protein